MMLRKCIVLLSLLLLVKLAAAEFSIETDRASGLYSIGETAVFTIRPMDAEGQPLTQGQLKVVLSRDGGKTLEQRSFDLSKTPVPEISASLDTPGFLRITLPGYRDSKNKTDCAGAGFEPEKIVPGASPPADFDAFWEQQIASAENIPLDPRVEPLAEFSTEKFTCYAVSFAAPGGRVFGFLTVPTAAQPVPAIVYVPPAGPGNNVPVLNQFDNKLAVLLMNVHDYDPRSPEKTLSELYAQTNSSGWYPRRNSDDPKAYFYHRAILGINRAVNYLAQRPDIDSKRIGTFGISQGGAFALILAGLNSHIRAAVANVPAMCDHYAFRQNRHPGWPRLVDSQQPASEKWAGYYDVVNFCRRVRVPVRVIAGFADSTCPPSTVYAAFNVISTDDKQIIGEVGMGHTSRKSYGTANHWLFSYLSNL